MDKKSIIQFIKFSVIGVSNTLVSLVVYYIFVFIDPSLYIVGNTVGYAAGVLNSYFWNERFVFDRKGQSHLKGIFKMYMSSIFIYLLNTGLLFVLVKYVSLSEKIAPLIVAAVLLPCNFLINKFWTFRQRKKDNSR